MSGYQWLFDPNRGDIRGAFHWDVTGTPTSGFLNGIALPGALCANTVDGTWYYNSGTQAATVWTLWAASTTAFNGTVGALTPSTGVFTTLQATAIGGITPGSGVFTTADATAIGSVTPGTGAFTTLGTSGLASLSSAKLDTGTKTASATAGAATLNKSSGVITTESLTTAANATYTLTLTNSLIAAADMVFASVQFGTSNQGTPTIVTVTPGSSQVVIVILNDEGVNAFNGTLKISFMVLKA